MKNIYLVRHAESKSQTGEVLHVDSNLTERGEKQASRLHDVLKGIYFNRIFISPLKRARQTFERANIEKNNVEVDSRIIECLSKEFYEPLLPYQEWPYYADKDQYNAWLLNGRERCESFLKTLRHSTGDNLLVVSHGAFLSLLLNLFLSERHGEIIEPLFKYCPMQNASVSMIFMSEDLDEDRLLMWNNNNHVSDLLDDNIL